MTYDATVYLHTEHCVAPVDDRIFGGFLEHLGRAVYEGVYDPGNPLSDEQASGSTSSRRSSPLRMPVVRYPGGNFVSAYDWRKGVGPRGPGETTRLRVEPDRERPFGTDEFMEWCAPVGTSPMMAVNLGTGTPADAAELLEYCNLPAGTSIADQRVANGHREPYGVELWCLGNEMDGFWQAGHVPADVYAEQALVASQLMKGLDPSIKTIACGSSLRDLPTYLEWDRIVLEHCWDSIDFVSVHRYSGNQADDTPSYLAEGVVIDQTLDEYRGLLVVCAGHKRGLHDVGLCFDEWNVWYRTHPAHWPARGALQPRGCARVRAVPERLRAKRRHRLGRVHRTDRQRHRSDPHPGRRSASPDDLLAVQDAPRRRLGRRPTRRRPRAGVATAHLATSRSSMPPRRSTRHTARRASRW